MESKKKSIKESLLEITEFLNKNNFNYALIGGIAYSVIYEPRATFDIDFIIDVKDIFNFIKVLKENKKFINVHKDPMKFENAIIERAIYENYTVIDFLIADDDFKKNILNRKREIKISDKKIYITTIEDLILLKLLSKREQDLLDVKNLLNLNNLNIEYIKDWIKKLNIEINLNI